MYQTNYSSSVCFLLLLLFSIHCVLKNDLGCVESADSEVPPHPTYGYSVGLRVGYLHSVSIPVILIHMAHESHFQKHYPRNLCYFIG